LRSLRGVPASPANGFSLVEQGKGIYINGRPDLAGELLLSNAKKEVEISKSFLKLSFIMKEFIVSMFDGVDYQQNK
jgi:hypothetical protein